MGNQEKDIDASVSGRLWDTIKKKAVEHLATTIVLAVVAAIGTGATAMWVYIKELSFNEMPPGAVVAFDLKDGCPKGWDNVGKHEPERFAGRTLIAIGPSEERNLNHATTKRIYGSQGGEENITLSVEHIPDIVKAIPLAPSAGERSGYGLYENENAAFLDRVAVINTGSVTKTIPNQNTVAATINNMPPYIALHFCKKNEAP